MSLQFIIGSSGSGKSHTAFQTIIDESLKNPSTMYYVIVPEQFTFAAQRTLVDMHPGKGILNIDVLSFNNIGLIKPLELTDGLQSLIVDGSYLYWLHNGTTSVVGEWDYTTGNLIINADIQKSLARNDIFKQLKNNITLLNGHKHLMIPYNLSPLNKINVKEKKK